jgi:hypothetical protein
MRGMLPASAAKARSSPDVISILGNCRSSTRFLGRLAFTYRLNSRTNAKLRRAVNAINTTSAIAHPPAVCVEGLPCRQIRHGVGAQSVERRNSSTVVFLHQSNDCSRARVCYSGTMVSYAAFGWKWRCGKKNSFWTRAVRADELYQMQTIL